jgi:spoIIIJ-associated protein
MSIVIEKTGKNVDEAVNNAIEELQCSIDDVSVEILDEGAKGIFGLIGVKVARVKVTRKDTPGEKVVKYLQTIFDKMNVVV